ncbi:MAG: DNA cytosine methyltransferase [Azoarcus sp.]|nr:DNA cytosine methyltransferase [Azoarcus sp.]
MAVYYNERDPYPAQWLRNLIAAGHLPAGEVDERSIADVEADDLAGFAQCHFFAGIGGWPLALRLAGWPDERPAWTGSCPCQSFSAAGRRTGFADPRHLWPVWFRLIRARRPATIFGEQVEAAIRHDWLDLVADDLEGLGYAIGATVLPAAGVGAPHLRSRLWFVADAPGQRLHGRGARQAGDGRNAPWQQPERLCHAGGLGDAVEPGLEGLAGDDDHESGWTRPAGSVSAAGAVDELADAVRPGRAKRRAGAGGGSIAGGVRLDDPDPGPADGLRRDADWLFCRDGKWRPVEPGTFPLAHGIPARVGRLRAYGNAIVPQVAAAFIQAFMEYMP